MIGVTLPALLIDLSKFFFHCFSGQLITKAEQTFIKQCMKCLFQESYQLPECQYVYCYDDLTLSVYCSKVQWQRTLFFPILEVIHG